MVNTRSKFRKIQNTLKICFPQSHESDHEPPSESGELIGSNDDLLTEILLRLPATSILRFKSVSKHWLSLLTHCPFTLMYDNRLISRGLFYRDLYVPFDVENSRPPFRSLDFYHDRCGIRIMQSCNGLLLCCSDIGTERCRKYYVFNPTTKQFAVIPSVIGGPDLRKNISFMGLAFHQTDCVHYKLVCIYLVTSNWKDVGLFRIQIYSSHRRKWKISNESFSAVNYTPFTCGAYWNGAIHWAPSCFNSLYFKLDVEKVQKLPLPNPMKAAYSRYHIDMPVYFGESRGHLHLVEAVDRKRPLQLNVYEMLSDHSGWVVKFQVDLNELKAKYPEMGYNYQHRWTYSIDFKVLDFVRGEDKEEEEEEGDTFMVVKVPSNIKIYNILNKSFKHLFKIPTIGDGIITQTEVHRYIETLGSF